MTDNVFAQFRAKKKDDNVFAQFRTGAAVAPSEPTVDIGSGERPEGLPQSPQERGLEAFGLGVARGVMDPIDAGAQMLTRGLEAATGSDWMRAQREDVERINREREAAYQATNPDANPWASGAGRIAGNVVATLPIAAAGPGSTASGFLPRLASGVVGGAATAPFTQPILEPGDDYAAQLAKQAGMGALGGAGGAVVGAGIRRVATPVREEVRNLIREGVTPTLGRIIGGTAARAEDRLLTTPLVGDVISSARNKAIGEFETATLNKALAPIGEKIPKGVTGFDAIEAAQNAVSSAYQRTVPKMTLRGGDAAFVQDLADVRSSAMWPQARAQWDEMMRQELRPILSNQPLKGEELQGIIVRLGEIARSASRSTDATQREVGQMANRTRSAFTDLLGRANPSVAGDFSAVQKASAMLMRAERAARKEIGKEGDVAIAPGNLARATREMDYSSRGRQSAGGNALMQDWAQGGVNVLGAAPSQGSAARRLLTNAGAGAALFGAGAGVSPWMLVPPALMSLPYLPGGRQAAAALLARGRGPTTQAVGELGGLLSVPLGASLMAAP